MAKTPVAAEAVFQHAECFYQAFAALRSLSPDPRENMHGAITLVEPLIVLASLTSELFLKCLICIETGDTPREHNLKELFDQLSEGTRARIQRFWDREVAARKREEWDNLEKFGLKMPRDLPSALAKGSNAFIRYRYSYEGNTEGLHYYLEELPALLQKLILEMNPNLESCRRAPLPLLGVSYH
ncbi:hypothetical protein [Bradyrhizobium sp. Ash2021]|uniref:hypothetical protein n=1 Tax=Bradyrhizobium sp. Ash2021 TaxID=2954771 RepID=UPI002815A9B5|nr:hypothetical protein [Bradyrhizobium sp. Ash2021]WMT73871.1 hypothetical protein NL528_39135 [Bradyrhizobium sp. Ash2021]